MDRRVYFGKVHIIEWLQPDETKTGRELFDELQPMGLMSKPTVEVAYQPVRTRDEFIAHVRTIAAELRVTGRLPLLQIETHGIYLHDDKVPDGIQRDGRLLHRGRLIQPGFVKKNCDAWKRRADGISPD